MKTDSGYSKDTGVTLFTLAILGIPSAITPIGQLQHSPPSPIPGDLGRGSSRQSTCSAKDTYGQAQVCSKGHQRSCVDRPCQPSFHRIKFWHVRNPLPQSIRLRLSVLPGRSGRVKFILNDLRWKKEPTHLSLPYDYCLVIHHP